jgi:hypothetical protein
VVTVSMDIDGAESAREWVDAAGAEHPSLVDTHHQLDALFGVVNVPNVIWIDEDGIIVRPPEPGWAAPVQYPEWLSSRLEEQVRKAREDAEAEGRAPIDPRRTMGGGQDRDAYADALRDWAHHGTGSRYAMTPDDVIAASQPRDPHRSESAARFDLGRHLWETGDRTAAIEQWKACHQLQPDNWTYKRQAWSLVGNEQLGGGVAGRFNQGPLPGREDEWPFPSSFRDDVAALEAGQYYPKTI